MPRSVLAMSTRTTHDDGWTVHAATDDERTEEEDDRLWPDLVGGAFSRPPLAARATRKRGKAHLKRRRGRRSDDSTSSANSFRKAHASHGEGKVAKSESVALDEDLASHHADSGWSTEDSTVSDALNRGGSVEPLVDSVLRRRAAQLHPGASSATEADTDADGHDHRHHHHQHAVDAKTQPLALLQDRPQWRATHPDRRDTAFGARRVSTTAIDAPLCRADMPNFSFFQDHRPNSALLKVLVSDTATFSDEDAMDSDSTQEAAYAGISIAMNADGDSKAASHLDRRAGYIIDDDPRHRPSPLRLQASVRTAQAGHRARGARGAALDAHLCVHAGVPRHAHHPAHL
ncbi:hypothetical protein L1887_43634 [Cichorium endivia]|nr:hypothetical protein L1887_43634 [Cichorium endivia]